MANNNIIYDDSLSTIITFMKNIKMYMHEQFL